MSAHPTIQNIARGAAAAITVIAALALAGPASAAEPAVTYVAGNPSCADLGAQYAEVKIEPVKQGQTTFAGGTIEVHGLTFDWSVPAGVDAVIVKGGGNANVYRAADGDELIGGSFFHAPANPANGTPYGLSHISFCSDGADATPAMPGAPSSPAAAPAPGPCEPGGPTTMPDGSACQKAPQPAPAPAPAQGQVLGDRASGTAGAGARLRTPRNCVGGVFRTVVRGKGIRRVTLFVNGRRIETFPGGRSRYALRIDPTDHPSGVMRVVARVQFVKASGRRPRTLRATVLRCAVSQVAPSFTG